MDASISCWHSSERILEASEDGSALFAEPDVDEADHLRPHDAAKPEPADSV